MKTLHKKRLSLLPLLGICFVALTGCVGTRMGTSWPALGLINHNGEEHLTLAYNNDITILSPANGSPARLINPNNEKPLLDSEGNPREWILRGTDNENAQFYSAPIKLDEETLLVADNNKRLLRVDSVVVEAQRTIALSDKVLADMLLADGILYVPYQNGGLSALSLETMREIWRFPTEEGVWAKPLLVEDLLIFGSLDHFLYAVDKDSGQLRWAADLGGSVASTPLLANGRLYVGSFNKTLFEVSLSGEILSEYATQNWVWGSPAIDEYGIVYVGDLSGYVHAVDGQAGLRPLWSIQVAERGIRAGPLVYGERIIVASRDGKVYWLDPRDGALYFAREIDERPELLGDMLLLEPSDALDIDEPLLLVTSVHDGRLVIAFDLDGRQTWVYPR